MTQSHPRLANHIRSSFRYCQFASHHEHGTCGLCGKHSVFLAENDNLKESLHCFHCGAWFRVRMMADQIVATYTQCTAKSLAELVKEPGFASLKVYEAAAQGALHEALKALPDYTCSEYIDGGEPGRYYKGVRCEDLQALTFSADRFDLVLHTSVLEHVRRPLQALEEAFRVLKPGGHLIFEIPMTTLGLSGLRESSKPRVDTSGDEDIFLLEKEYHGDPMRPDDGVLVYTDFGMDIADKLRLIGFDVAAHTRHLNFSVMSHAVVLVCRKPE